ncbi:SulP family inorganic anion transporter [Cyanobium sp. CH-040]|uniref:SulP family inorganic anion transporter n=1 Tax=Cyanobium sp. CH-040 TaxID=2823708 RepID=UPI0020CC61D6|nr:SulP family inorganic anion transporter [Cyanobium sp. CH-040]MCP9929062.1 SulP family inorganic anion transporter [Cyanobium sp. CH-040]
MPGGDQRLRERLAPRISHLIRHWKGDLTGGVTAAVVALPLALAFGVASGAGAIAGLYGAVSLGFLAALFGGTPTQVSGPTGPMTVIMTTVVTLLVGRYGPEAGLAMAFTVVVLAGGFQVLFGLMKLGQYITMMPYTVISGFMSGIGVIIIVLEVPPLLGVKLSGSVATIVAGLPGAISQTNPTALALGLATFALVMLYPRRWNTVLPAPLAALVLITLASVLLLPADAVPRLGAMPAGLPQLVLPRLSLGDLRTLAGFALTLAVLGAIDSLLTSLVADNVTRTHHDSDKELIGQGIGNIAAGLVGGLPGAGATMRTVTNVQAGGRTPLSGMVHALVLLVITLGAGPLASPIPQAVLAGILLRVGLDIIDWNFIFRAPLLSWKTTGLMWLVLILTVFWDLITAVVVGVFLANILTIKRQNDLQREQMRRLQGHVDLDAGQHDLSPQESRLLLGCGRDVLVMQLAGPLSFGAGKFLSQQLSSVDDFHTLVLDLSEVPLLGVTAALAIETICLDCRDQQRQVIIVSDRSQPVERLNRLGVDRILGVAFMVDRLSALQACSSQLAKAA